ncbi:hypothetical protein CAP31_08620 [Sulfuriferula sp. AH1]|uniref:hypothetical protein n=1 Tax=Sulfuriferula sp. AH1 TaxID=1985873 RepID=UPI000B3B6961|nr:hypothetical protein [Sulfuriferula sp. AH1]ARU31737.1 hypothetical protein CAP31_08620 [Sulfuriferula sp. AH1]
MSNTTIQLRPQPQKRGLVWLIKQSAVGLGKGWAWSLGLTSLKNEGVRIASNVSDLGAYVHRKLTEQPTCRHESFNDAVDRLGLTEEDLIRQAKIFNSRAANWFLSAAIGLLWMAFLPTSNSPFSHFLLCFGIILMSSAKAVTWRFRFCQIREEQLFGFGEWLRGEAGKW